MNIGDRVRLVNKCGKYRVSNSNPVYGSSEGKIIGTITIIEEDYSHGKYHVEWDNHTNNSNYCDECLEIDFPIMRRTIEKGGLVKVTSRPEVYKDLDEKVKELGGTDKWSGAYVPKIGDVGDVIGISGGYVLVDFQGRECLLDASCLESQKRKEEVKFLVRFPNGSLEEYSTEKELEARVQELYKTQALKIGETVKVYNVEGYKEVSVKIQVSFT